jgi:hypothetical protein
VVTAERVQTQSQVGQLQPQAELADIMQAVAADRTTIALDQTLTMLVEQAAVVVVLMDQLVLELQLQQE